jgi:hypothetical protein
MKPRFPPAGVSLFSGDVGHDHIYLWLAQREQTSRLRQSGPTRWLLLRLLRPEADRLAKNSPVPSKRGPRFDGTMRRPVAAVEARRSPS